MAFNIESVRSQFPSLAVNDNGHPRIYLDNPAGTQVPVQVKNRIIQYLTEINANLGGCFITSTKSEQIIQDAHVAAADFVNANSPDEITFGQNMTTLTFHISRSIGRLFSPGDEIIITRMEHDANVAPWLMLAEDFGLKVKWLALNTDNFELKLNELDDLLTDRTRLVAINYASNLLGTISDVKRACAKAKSAGALVYVDAVQYAPHGIIDVQDLDCDFLVCSPYKFYGPHMGMLWGRTEVLAQLTPYKVRAVPDQSPDRFETGTLGHELIAGFIGTIEYLSWLGKTMGDEDHIPTENDSGQKHYLRTGFELFKQYEEQLTSQLIKGLMDIPSIKIQGITDPAQLHKRVPTVSLTTDKHQPKDIAQKLAKKNIFVWDGHNYALEPTRQLGLLDKGGVVRIGMAHYNTKDEIDTLLNQLETIIN